jgi:hypothetical protein
MNNMLISRFNEVAPLPGTVLHTMGRDVLLAFLFGGLSPQDHLAFNGFTQQVTGLFESVAALCKADRAISLGKDPRNHEGQSLRDFIGQPQWTGQGQIKVVL